ncbi:MAG: dihydropteroate synthase [Acidobacteriota bacterium]
MFSRAVLVWDLLDEDGAQLFLAPLQLPSAATPALPCRGLRLPVAIDRPGHTDVALHHGKSGTAACGTHAALVRWCAALPDPWNTACLNALTNYARPAEAFRWADGQLCNGADRVRVMGVLNATPDSFSDGGRFVDQSAAIAAALAMADEGADIIDIGGESTRPAALPVDPTEEKERVIPLITALKRESASLRISIDTRNASTARHALDAGADMVNDVSALSDPAMAPLIAHTGVPVVLMHLRGTPRTMQRDTHYDDLLGNLSDFLAERAKSATEAGIAGDRILVDPGFGFGKSPRGNEEILRQLKALTSLGLPLLVGMSRKRFIGERTGVVLPDARLAGSLAAAVAAALAGASVVRVHDVRATREALAVASALRPGQTPAGGR